MVSRNFKLPKGFPDLEYATLLIYIIRALFRNGLHSQGVEYMPQHTNTYALARTNLRQYIHITKGPNQKMVNDSKQEQIRSTDQTQHQQTQQTFKKQYTMQHEQEIKKTPNHIDRHEIHKKSPKLPKQKSQNSSKKKQFSGAP